MKLNTSFTNESQNKTDTEFNHIPAVSSPMIRVSPEIDNLKGRFN